MTRVLIGECGRLPSSKPRGKHKANLIKVIWVHSNHQALENHGSTINFSTKGTWFIQANELKEDMGLEIASKHSFNSKM